MNYQKVYEQLVSRAKTRDKLNCYIERHHIIPRSLGGSDDEENLVEFTAREHFIAHLLLAKIHGGKMIHAAYLMSSRKGHTNRIYEKMRLQFSEGIKINKERGRKISKSLKGLPKTEGHKEAWKQSRKLGGGWVCPDHKKTEQKITMLGSGNPMWGKTHNESARKIISEANKQKIVCPHCQKEGGVAIMKRWHFDNCKFAPESRERKKYTKSICPHCGREGGGSRMISNHFDNCRKKLTQ
jgi:hypothetical protein